MLMMLVRGSFFVPPHQVEITMKENIKNSAQVGPEGQTRLVNSATCNAGLPTCTVPLLIGSVPDKVSIPRNGKDFENGRRETRLIYPKPRMVRASV